MKKFSYNTEVEDYFPDNNKLPLIYQNIIPDTSSSFVLEMHG